MDNINQKIKRKLIGQYQSHLRKDPGEWDDDKPLMFGDESGSTDAKSS